MRSPRIPTGDRTAVSFGLGWSLTDDVTVDLAYAYLWEEETKVSREHPSKGIYNATYESSAHGFGTAIGFGSSGSTWLDKQSATRPFRSTL